MNEIVKETLIVTKEGAVFKTKPAVKSRKLPNGNWEQYIEGVELTGCPLCRIVFYNDVDRDNPVLTMLRTSFNLVQL